MKDAPNPPEDDESDAPFIDLSEVAAESSTESIAHENELVEHFAHDGYPERPAQLTVDEQLAGLVDPDELRSG